MVKKAADKAQLEALGAALCPMEEVVTLMGWETRTVVFKFEWERKAYEKSRATALNDLRKTELSMAKKNVAMATTLGRRYLGQTEQREQNESAPIDYAAIKERHRARVRDILAAGKEDTD
jgi:hypothetical protein